jgi:sulfate permease, SulP family
MLDHEHDQHDHRANDERGVDPQRQTILKGVGGELFFASVGQMRSSLNNSLAEIRPPVKHVLLDFSSVDFIDVSACDELLTFIKELQSQDITIAFARVRDGVRENMQLGGIEAVVGSANFYERITDGVDAWRRRQSVST